MSSVSAISRDPSGLGYDDVCPVRFSADVVAFSDVQVALTGIACLEGLEPRVIGPDDEPLRQDVLHLEHKVDVLMQLLCGLCAHTVERPAARALWVSENAVVISATDVEGAQDAKSISLWLHPLYPNPVVLPVDSVVVENGKTMVALAELPNNLAESFGRHVFRRHRRDLAKTRQE